MMRLIVNGEPYVYTHKCSGCEKKGDAMTKEGMQQFLVETLHESFCQCGSNIRKVNDNSWKYPTNGKPGIFHGLFSSQNFTAFVSNK